MGQITMILFGVAAISELTSKAPVTTTPETHFIPKRTNALFIFVIFLFLLDLGVCSACLFKPALASA
jgi:hypothetical protein